LIQNFLKEGRPAEIEVQLFPITPISKPSTPPLELTKDLHQLPSLSTSAQIGTISVTGKR